MNAFDFVTDHGLVFASWSSCNEQLHLEQRSAIPPSIMCLHSTCHHLQQSLILLYQLNPQHFTKHTRVTRRWPHWRCTAGSAASPSRSQTSRERMRKHSSTTSLSGILARDIINIFHRSLWFQRQTDSIICCWSWRYWMQNFDFFWKKKNILEEG